MSYLLVAGVLKEIRNKYNICFETEYKNIKIIIIKIIRYINVINGEIQENEISERMANNTNFLKETLLDILQTNEINFEEKSEK